MNTLISIPFFSLSAPCQKRTLRFLSRLAVVFILFASPAFSQFTHPQVGEGLTAGKVTCIVQDQRGFIWLGSDHGITRYDGYNYKAFRHNPDNNHSPSANEVRALCLDTAGKIWIGTLKGLDYFDPVTETFSHYVHRPEDPGSISSDQVTSLFRDSRGSVWVGTRFGGLNQVVSPKTAETKPAHRFRKFKPFSPVPGQTRGAFSISSITEDNKGSLWIGTVGGGLHSLHPVSGATKLHRSTISGIVPDSDLDVYAVRADAAGNIWLGTDKYGLYRIDAHTRQWKAFNPPAGKLEDDAHQIVEDTPGVFWIGTWQGGLYQLDAGKEQWTHYSAGEGNGKP
jgi:ligand-binding sensor domain-containing protein